MPTPSLSKSDLQDQINRATEILEDAYDPAATRGEMANAIGSAIAILRGEDDDSPPDYGDDALD